MGCIHAPFAAKQGQNPGNWGFGEQITGFRRHFLKEFSPACL
jgi:hypothetical protein